MFNRSSILMLSFGKCLWTIIKRRSGAQKQQILDDLRYLHRNSSGSHQNPNDFAMDIVGGQESLTTDVQNPRPSGTWTCQWETIISSRSKSSTIGGCFHRPKKITRDCSLLQFFGIHFVLIRTFCCNMPSMHNTLQIRKKKLCSHAKTKPFIPEGYPLVA